MIYPPDGATSTRFIRQRVPLDRWNYTAPLQHPLISPYYTIPHHHIRLTKQAKLDLTVWQEFLDNFNRRAFLLTDRFHTDGCLDLYTDASGSVGYRAIYGKAWFWGKWPSTWLTRNIAVLELFPIMAAVVVWGGGCTWANQNVRFFTDNEVFLNNY